MRCSSTIRIYSSRPTDRMASVQIPLDATIYTGAHIGRCMLLARVWHLHFYKSSACGDLTQSDRRNQTAIPARLTGFARLVRSGLIISADLANDGAEGREAHFLPIPNPMIKTSSCLIGQSWDSIHRRTSNSIYSLFFSSPDSNS